MTKHSILRNGTQPSIKGPEAWFTGTVRIDPLFPSHGSARAQPHPSRLSRARAPPGIPTRWARP